MPHHVHAAKRESAVKARAASSRAERGISHKLVDRRWKNCVAQASTVKFLTSFGMTTKGSGGKWDLNIIEVTAGVSPLMRARPC
jgi:hypothetical protein